MTNRNTKPVVVCLAGTTASGKTGLALQLSERFPFEIVCMDSMQIYRGMDIGTAKPTPEEQRMVRHHMLDVIDPAEAFSVAEYTEQARICIDLIHSRGHIPLLVGGTGLYLRALSLPLSFGGIKGDAKIREKYAAFAREKGNAALHAVLFRKDPAAAEKLHENDMHRVIRALEVYDLTGKPFSAQEMPSYDEGFYHFLIYALDVPRDVLYDRINRRVDKMLDSGLLGEVGSLLNRGVPASAQSMQGLGYKELIPVLLDGSPLDAAVQRIRQRTRNYAKRQLTWFRRDTRIRWLDASSGLPPDRIMNDLEDIL